MRLLDRNQCHHDDGHAVAAYRQAARPQDEERADHLQVVLHRLPQVRVWFRVHASKPQRHAQQERDALVEGAVARRQRAPVVVHGE